MPTPSVNPKLNSRHRILVRFATAGGAGSAHTALMAIILLPLCCGASFRFTHSAEECTAIGEDSIVVVVRTESGAAQSFLGPCPKIRSTVEEVTFYTLTYKLSRSQDRPVRSAPLRFAAKDVQHPGESRSNPFSELFLKRLDVPPAANLYAGLNKRIVNVEGQIPPQDAPILNGLGFDASRAVFTADMPDGRWYMGFNPFQKGVQLCCPGKRLLLRQDLECHYGSIWDPEHSRVVFITSDQAKAPITGDPNAVTIWDYGRNTLTTYRLWQPPRSEFR